MPLPTARSPRAPPTSPSPRSASFGNRPSGAKSDSFSSDSCMKRNHSFSCGRYMGGVGRVPKEALSNCQRLASRSGICTLSLKNERRPKVSTSRVSTCGIR
jgi:hypothetical protein